MLKRIDKEDEGYILGKTVRKVLDTPLLTPEKVINRTSENELFYKVIDSLEHDGLYSSAEKLKDSNLTFNAVKAAYAIGFVNGGRYHRDFIADKLFHILNRNYYKDKRKKEAEIKKLLKEVGIDGFEMPGGTTIYPID